MLQICRSKIATILRQMSTVKFITKERTKGNQGYPVLLYINVQSKRITISTGIFIKEREYLKNDKISRKDILWSEKNQKLTKILTEANSVLLKENDFKIIKEKINEIFKPSVRTEKKLIDYIREYSLTKKHNRTAKLYECTLNKVKAYDKGVKAEDVDKKWLAGFENYCLQNMSINGYSVYMRNIRTVINWLIERDIINNYPFKNFTIKREETVHRALNASQVRELMKINFPIYIIRYRDFFLLMIYLIGINPKDLLNLKASNIIDGRIVYHRFKTNKLYSIKIEPEAMEIVKKYSGKKYLLKFMDHINDYLGFVKRANNNLRKLKGFDNITSYWARHTWASIAFEAGVSKDIISLALGHSNGVKVTDIYIKYDLKMIDEANRKVIDYIKGKSEPSQALTTKVYKF